MLASFLVQFVPRTRVMHKINPSFVAAKPQYPSRKLLLAGGHSHLFPYTFGWGLPQCCAKGHRATKLISSAESRDAKSFQCRDIPRPSSWAWISSELKKLPFNNVQYVWSTVSAMFSTSTCMIELKKTAERLNRLAWHREYSHRCQISGIFSTSKSVCLVIKWGSSSVFQWLIKKPKIKQPSLN